MVLAGKTCPSLTHVRKHVNSDYAKASSDKAVDMLSERVENFRFHRHVLKGEWERRRGVGVNNYVPAPYPHSVQALIE